MNKMNTKMESTHHAHGTFQPQPERGVYLLREPKGIPDLLLLAHREKQTILLSAANILSVQGVTARIVILEDPSIFLEQPIEYRNTIFTAPPMVHIGLIDRTIAEKISGFPLHCLDQSVSPAILAATAIRLLHTNESPQNTMQ